MRLQILIALTVFAINTSCLGVYSQGPIRSSNNTLDNTGFGPHYGSDSVASGLPSSSSLRESSSLSSLPPRGQPASGTTDRAHRLMTKASQASVEVCEAVTDSDSCHRSYAAGCSHSENSTADPYLNFLKNLLPSPKSSQQASVGILSSLTDFQNFDEQSITLGIGKQKQKAFGEQLADIGEGNIFTLVGFIYYAIPGGVEVCNCQLANPDDKDFHIGLGFDSDTAKGILNGSIVPHHGKSIDKSLQQASVIVEMTPHYRNQFHENWTLPLVQSLEGAKVKIVGQLLMDNEHNTPQQSCAFPSHTDTCWRASVWEMHPVIQVWVCKSGQSCSASTDDGWQLLDEMSPE